MGNRWTIGTRELWTPADITVNAWFDASDTSTITEGSPGFVSQWDDKSGNGYDLSQGVGSNQPLIGSYQIDGKDTISFSSTNLYLETNTKFGLPSPNSDLMVAAVLHPINTGDRRWLEIGDSSSGAFRPSLDYGIRYGGGYIEWDIAASGEDMLGVWQQETGNRYDEAKFFYEGTERTRISPDKATIWGNSATQARLGDTLGGSTGTFSIGELVIIESIDIDIRQKLEGYLAHKWGLA